MQAQRNGHATGHVLLVERKRGDKFYVHYRLPDGRQVKKLIGPAWTGRPGRPPVGHYTRKMAEAELRAILTDADRGLHDRGRGQRGVTFAIAAAEYLRYVEQIKKIDATTVKDYRGVIDGYLIEEFGEIEITSITPDLIDAYKERLISEGKLSNRTIVRHLTVLHGIFKRAKRAYGLAENPASADLVERPKVVYTGEFDTYDRDELTMLVTAAETPQDGCLYTVAAYTGLRQGELLALRWRSVDFVGGLLHVRRNYTDGVEKVPKGRRVRSVPMVPDVVDALARLKDRGYMTEDDDLVFVSATGAHLDHFNVRRCFYRAIKRAGLRRIRFHDLRHHFGTMAITVLDGYAVQSYMGHQHYSTTQRYLHHKPRPADAARLHQAFGGGDRVPERVPNEGISAPTENNSSEPKPL